MNIEDAKKRGIFTMRIMLGKAWDVLPETMPTAAELEKANLVPVLSAKEAELKDLYKDEWIELREPSMAQSTRMQKAGEDIEKKIEIAIECTIGSSFGHEGGGNANAAEVWGLIRESLTLAAYALGEWDRAIPLVRRSNFMSARLPSSSSTAAASQPPR
jgi:hypothetical protein